MLVYAGTYTEPIRFGNGQILQGKGEGIYVFRLDPRTGALELIRTVKGVANPSWLAFDATGRFLYAVNELKSFQDQPTGTITAFAVDPATGDLTLLNRRPTHGTDPCHAVVDRDREHVFVANFMSGSVCVLPINGDGSLGPACDFIQHLGSGIDPVRQNGPHAHSVALDPEGRYAFVPDLGLDKMFIYRFDARRGMLEPNVMPWIKMRPGAGPRHVVPHPDGRFAYLINELDSTVATLAWDHTTGGFEVSGIVSTLPADFRGESTCADIRIAPSGRFIYASNRGHDSIAVFAIDRPTGQLTPVDHVPTEGRTPRAFCLDPGGVFLLAANQDSDTIVTFRIDTAGGVPKPTGHLARVPTPVCVRIMDGGQPWPR